MSEATVFQREKWIVRLGGSLALLGLLLGSASCAAQAPLKKIAGSDVTYESFVFHSQLPVHMMDTDPEEFRTCRTSYWPIKRPRMSDFSWVLGVDKFYIETPGSGCEFTILDGGPLPQIDGAVELSNHGCDFLLQHSGAEIDHIFYAAKGDIEQSYNCLFRSRLFVMGFNGALEVPDRDLFVLRSGTPWRGNKRSSKEVPILHFHARFDCFEMQLFESKQGLSDYLQSIECKPGQAQ